jgi:hypothetical protein
MLNYNELKYLATKVAKTEGTLPEGAQNLPQDTSPSTTDKIKGVGDEMLNRGREYAPSIGYGAGAGAIAGIPIALLAHALTGDSKKKGLRSYLKSALLGALLGGGLGGAGGAGLRAYAKSSPERADLIGGGIDSAAGKLHSLAGYFGMDQKENINAGTRQLKDIFGAHRPLHTVE